LSRILLIDDESATRLILHNRLKDLGYVVVTAENGAKGLLEARESNFDLVLVDASLSTGINGFEVCRRLKQTPQTSAVPVLMLSKHTSSREELHKGYDSGCEAFLLKSDMGNLEDVIRAMLRIKSLQDDLARQNRALEDANRRLQQERQRGADLETSEKGPGEQALVVRELAAGRPDGVLLVDSEGVVRHADRGARELLGASLEGKNLGRLAPATGLEAFVRDARTEAREGFRFDLPGRDGRSGRSLSASVVPLVGNPGERDPGLRVVLLIDAGRRRVATELMRTQEYAIPRREVGVLLDAARVAFGPATLIGSSPAMTRVRAQVAEGARSIEPVLLLGEPGTGKEHTARAIHFGGFASGPFLPLNCSALSPANLDAELFGVVKGATPEAVIDRPGLFQQATSGSVFLEDVERLTSELQGKLLRVVKERQVQRVGSERAEPTSARILAASSSDLHAAAAAGAFLPELLDRLSTIEIRLSPLRERIEDVAGLTQHFLQRYGCTSPELEVTDEALFVLESHDWPGNVGELEAAVERACANATGDVIGVEELPAALRELHGTLPRRDLVPSPRRARVSIGGTHTAIGEGAPAVARVTPSIPEPRKPWEIGPEEPVSLDLYEKKALLRALEETHGDKLAAARLLKVGKSTLYRKLKRYGIG